MVFVDQRKPWYMCILLLEMRRISCEKELIFKIRVDVSAVDFYVNEPQDNSFKEISNLKYQYKSKVVINYIFRCNISYNKDITDCFSTQRKCCSLRKLCMLLQEKVKMLKKNIIYIKTNSNLL